MTLQYSIIYIQFLHGPPLQSLLEAHSARLEAFRLYVPARQRAQGGLLLDETVEHWTMPRTMIYGNEGRVLMIAMPVFV